MDSKNYRDIGELQQHAEECEARIGRQAIMIEQLQLAVGQGNTDYQKLINTVSQVVSGEIALERLKVLPDGLSWQVLALPEADVPQFAASEGICIAMDTSPEPIQTEPTAA